MTFITNFGLLLQDNTEMNYAKFKELQKIVNVTNDMFDAFQTQIRKSMIKFKSFNNNNKLTLIKGIIGRISEIRGKIVRGSSYLSIDQANDLGKNSSDKIEGGQSEPKDLLHFLGGANGLKVFVTKLFEKLYMDRNYGNFMCKYAP